MSLRKETENVFEAELLGSLVGAVGLEIDATNAKVSVVTSGSTRQVRVRVFTQDKKGASVEAVQQSEITLRDGVLKVFVPAVPQTMSNVVSYSTGDAVAYGAGSVAVSGVVMGNISFNSFGSVSSVSGGSQGVEVEIDFPALNVDAKVNNSSLVMVGSVDLLNAKVSNGSLRADTVHRLIAKVPNGSAKVDSVTGSMDVKADNGDVKIGRYDGHSAKVKASNGTIKIGIGSGARGDLKAVADNGKVTITGSRANPSVWVSASASNGRVVES